MTPGSRALDGGGGFEKVVGEDFVAGAASASHQNEERFGAIAFVRKSRRR